MTKQIIKVPGPFVVIFCCKCLGENAQWNCYRVLLVLDSELEQRYGQHNSENIFHGAFS